MLNVNDRLIRIALDHLIGDSVVDPIVFAHVYQSMDIYVVTLLPWLKFLVFPI
jgi:hypothetical protein